MIFCIGEILADMIGRTAGEAPGFDCFAGGAPFNVACAVKKLGGESGFYGAVGRDVIGDFLQEFAERQGLNNLLLDRREEANTTLAFVRLDENGERNFSFYRKGTADSKLKLSKARPYLTGADIVHFGSLPLSEPEAAVEIEAMMRSARKAGARVSFDVNYRQHVFGGDIGTLREAARLADIVKCSEEELYLLADADDLETGLKAFPSEQLVVVTLGERGSVCRYRGFSVKAGSLPVQVADSTGAGDVFYAAFLFCLAEGGCDTQEELQRALRFANIAGALTASARGALSAAPTYEQVARYL